MTSSSGNVPLTAARVHEVRLTNDDLFWRQPHVHGVGEGFLRNADGTWSTDYGISVYVTQATVQPTLPAADRIASTISGVPVRIVVEPELSYTGSIRYSEHRPVVAGVRVFSSVQKTVDNIHTTDVDEGGIPYTKNTGTLTGLATRNTDGKKFVVTNQHILTGDVRTSPAGHEELYQEDLTVASLDRLTVGKRIGGGDGLARGVPITEAGPNIADVAMCSYDHDSDADIGFLLHGHGGDANRRVIPGTVDPVFDDGEFKFSPRELLMVGARGGEGLVHVLGINQTRTVVKEIENTNTEIRTTFTGLIILGSADRPIFTGDSGSPCLVRVADGKYKMVAIEFASYSEDRDPETGDNVGYAFPASVAERELGVKFGNTPLSPKPSLPNGLTPQREYCYVVQAVATRMVIL